MYFDYLILVESFTLELNNKPIIDNKDKNQLTTNYVNNVDTK